MDDDQQSAGAGPACLRQYRTRRYHTIAVAGTLAIAVALTAGGAAARATDSGTVSTLSAVTSTASYLRTNSSTVASSVDGGVVDIVSTLKYENARSAGTGMVLTSKGEILTNNHVVDGATSITVTVTSTGRRYRATVVGTDPTDDVAVLQLSGASHLRTIPIGDSSAVQVGQAVIASGNAGGTGGTPSRVTGTVVALDQSITASDDGGGGAEQLTGLIETDAPIVAGDSGGPLASGGAVIGMDTAASASNEQAGYGSSTGSAASTTSQGYAIPIATALTIAHTIESGRASSTIHLGVHGFLGVQLASQFSGVAVSGVMVSGVVSGGAAERAGLSAGDVITAVDGHSVDSATALDTLMSGTGSGQRIRIAWTDSFGQNHTRTTTLDAAPID